MRTGSMSFSMFQLPRMYRIRNVGNILREGFHSWNKADGNSSGFKILSSKTNVFGGRHDKRWVRRPISTKPEVSKGTAQRNKSSSASLEVVDSTVTSSNILNIDSTDLSGFQKIQYSNCRQMIAENKELAKLVTLIAFDIETTGFSREHERIIEIAMQDLAGGDNSTFQTLVNPGRYVPNAHIHGISSHMVNNPEVPRMEELIPILLKYVQSRQKLGGYVLWVAHNARTFDVPFLVNEFSRCSYEIPSNWMFVDTLPLAREQVKSEGEKLPSYNLQALREHYQIPLVGSAHRAMSDVNTLALILQKLSLDMKLPVSGLVERSFTPSDLNSAKKKKKT